jgi:hypothetical protein
MVGDGVAVGDAVFVASAVGEAVAPASGVVVGVGVSVASGVAVGVGIVPAPAGGRRASSCFCTSAWNRLRLWSNSFVMSWTRSLRWSSKIRPAIRSMSATPISTAAAASASIQGVTTRPLLKRAVQ